IVERINRRRFGRVGRVFRNSATSATSTRSGNRSSVITAFQSLCRLIFAVCRVHWVRPEMVVEVTYVEWTLMGCSDTSSILANARISWLVRCAAAHPTLARLNRGKVGSTILSDVQP